MNLALLWLMLIPLVLSIFTGVAITLFVGWNPDDSVFENLDRDIGGKIGFPALLFVVSFLVFASFIYMGRGMKTHDTQTINGTVVAKIRQSGSHEESYSCNCVTTTDSKGRSSTSCQTCWETHYTVDWWARTTIGDIGIQHKDWTNPGVYMLPDPPRYVAVTEGEPASKIVSYVNYVKAVPESLFHPASEEAKKRFFKLIPGYPDKIYADYKLDRVISVGVNILNLDDWNRKLGMALERLGPEKQANAIIVFVRTSDPDYFYALEDAWVHAKKNDIVVVIGTDNLEQKPDWVRVMAYSQSSIFETTLQDHIADMDHLTPDKVIGTLSQDTIEYFQRQRMHHYKYLESEIDPPAWMIWCSIIVVALMYALFNGYVFANNTLPGQSRSHRIYTYNRY